MAFQSIENVAIRGISACVPKEREDNQDLPLFGSKEDADEPNFVNVR